MSLAPACLPFEDWLTALVTFFVVYSTLIQELL